jgi:hypothetical protein
MRYNFPNVCVVGKFISLPLRPDEWTTASEHMKSINGVPHRYIIMYVLRLKDSLMEVQMKVSSCYILGTIYLNSY